MLAFLYLFLRSPVTFVNISLSADDDDDEVMRSVLSHEDEDAGLCLGVRPDGRRRSLCEPSMIHDCDWRRAPPIGFSRGLHLS